MKSKKELDTFLFMAKQPSILQMQRDFLQKFSGMSGTQFSSFIKRMVWNKWVEREVEKENGHVKTFFRVTAIGREFATQIEKEIK